MEWDVQPRTVGDVGADDNDRNAKNTHSISNRPPPTTKLYSYLDSIFFEFDDLIHRFLFRVPGKFVSDLYASG